MHSLSGYVMHMLSTVYSYDCLGYLRFETDVPILYMGKPQSLISKRDGLKICIPESTLSLDVNKVQFKAFFSGWFQFPEGTELVSGLYWIDCPVKQTKVEIQHCAAAKPADLPHVLTFVECTQEASLLSGQQDQFKVLDGGVFSSSSRYGSIDLSHSSIVAIVSKQNPTRSTTKYWYWSQPTWLIEKIFSPTLLQKYWYAQLGGLLFHHVELGHSYKCKYFDVLSS